MSTHLCISNLGKILKTLIVFMILVLNFEVSAQCPQSLGCNDNIQISLDYECFAVITPDLVLEDERTGCDYTVTILTANDVIIDQTHYDMYNEAHHPVIDGSFIGAPYKASVSFMDNNGTIISCWGWFNVEDKLPPELTCIDDLTVDCSDDLSELYTSMGLARYCSDFAPADADTDPNTITIDLFPVTDPGSTMPWELIDYIDVNVPLVPCTGSGTGLIVSNGGSYEFDEDPVDPDIYRGDISGVQATDDNLSDLSLVIWDTPANRAAIAQGLCIDINTVSFYKYQESDNCDPDVEVIINRDDTETLECSQGRFTARRDIEYYTRDHVGLSAEVCAFSIYFEKKSLTDLEFPDNVVFYCDDPTIIDDGELNLDPENTGQPTVDGFPLTDTNNFCHINVTFRDDTFSVCGINTVKILRRWTALDWCEGEYAQSYQTIKVVDEHGPDIECPEDGLIFYTIEDCEAVVDFRPFDANDVTGLRSVFDCASMDVRVEYLREDQINPLLSEQVFTPATRISSGVYRASGLQHGKNYIRYIVTDECGNESECEFEIYVRDNLAPYAICDQYTVVSLADNGWGRLYPQSVDDGSYDNCGGPVTLSIRRDMTACSHLPEYEGNDLEFGEYIQFCCQEAGQTVPVIMRVVDESGRSNTCQVQVIVQDKTGVEIESCPKQLVFNFECETTDQIDPSITGMPVINGDCGIGTLRYEDSGTVNELCGEGTIMRRWYVDLPDRTIELESCQQEFNFSSDLLLNQHSFTWPADRDDATCENYTTDLGDAVLYQGVPVSEAAICANLGYSYKDRVFRDIEGYCLKVIRTWRVYNWCHYQQGNNSGNGFWESTQVIKVIENEGPLLIDCPVDLSLSVAPESCSQFVSFQPPKALDECEKAFLHPLQLDYEITENGQLVEEGSGPIVDLELSTGSYTVTWYAEGICSSVSTCSHDILIRDDKAPSPYCRAGLTTSLTTPANPQLDPYVEIWASDFDLGSSDNCDPSVELSFDKDDLSIKSKLFTCSDLGINSVTVWVTDDMGNQDFCITTISIQDNLGVCPDTAGMMIGGHIQTEFNEMVENVEVGLQAMIDESMRFDRTDVKGEFAFNNVGSYQDYQLKVNSPDDYLNGVSTLDLIIIQRHILGMENLESPYQLIASDVNNSQDITALDLIELRKLILGIYDELPNNTSWQYVDKSYNFLDINNPWPYRDNIDIYDVEDDMMNNDFIAVKIGDVNGSASLQPESIRIDHVDSFTDPVVISHDMLELDGSDEYLVPFYFNSGKDIMGLQAHIEFDNKKVEVLDLESGRLSVENDNFFIHDGRVSLVWHNDRAIESAPDDALFYLVVRVSAYHGDALFTIAKNQLLASEIVDNSFSTHSIIVEKQKGEFENVLYQNIPNPFSGLTSIDFELSKTSTVRINVFDPGGRLVLSRSGDYPKGRSSMIIRSDDLKGNGIYYYQMETETFSSTRKMIVIE